MELALEYLRTAGTWATSGVSLPERAFKVALGIPTRHLPIKKRMLYSSYDDAIDHANRSMDAGGSPKISLYHYAAAEHREVLKPFLSL
jgi:hypothetical protein